MTPVGALSLLFLSAITLDNTLVILSTVAPDAGRYYAQAVNDKNGENKTSQPVVLTVESKYACGTRIPSFTMYQRGNYMAAERGVDGAALPAVFALTHLRGCHKPMGSSNAEQWH